MEIRRYYSNGKILLSAEYLVLFGARALALPVRYGQSLELFDIPPSSPEKGKQLRWESTVMGDFWFQAVFDPENLEVRASNDKEVAGRLGKILQAARSLNPGFLPGRKELLVKTNINFNRFWGLGTSSSLISNIAYWAGVDPFLLHRKLSRGSGFDIACARSQTPVLFRSSTEGPEIIPVQFCPPFRDALYFVYLGQKQDSEDSVIRFLKKHPPSARLIKEVDMLTMEMLETGRLDRFNCILDEHEALLSGLLGQQTLKESLFQGFKGGVKSLGAWGGDFILVTWDGPYHELEGYLRERDLFTVFGFNEMILSPEKETS